MLARHPHVEDAIGRNFKNGSPVHVGACMAGPRHGAVDQVPSTAKERWSPCEAPLVSVIILSTTTGDSALANLRAQTTSHLIIAAGLSALVISSSSRSSSALARQHRSSARAVGAGKNAPGHRRQQHDQGLCVSIRRTVLSFTTCAI